MPPYTVVLRLYIVLNLTVVNVSHKGADGTQFELRDIGCAPDSLMARPASGKSLVKPLFASLNGSTTYGFVEVLENPALCVVVAIFGRFLSWFRGRPRRHSGAFRPGHHKPQKNHFFLIVSASGPLEGLSGVAGRSIGFNSR